MVTSRNIFIHRMGDQRWICVTYYAFPNKSSSLVQLGVKELNYGTFMDLFLCLILYQILDHSCNFRSDL